MDSDPETRRHVPEGHSIVAGIRAIHEPAATAKMIVTKYLVGGDAADQSRHRSAPSNHLLLDDETDDTVLGLGCSPVTWTLAS